jgi:hypothetical protein
MSEYDALLSVDTGTPAKAATDGSEYDALLSVDTTKPTPKADPEGPITRGFKSAAQQFREHQAIPTNPAEHALWGARDVILSPALNTAGEAAKDVYGVMPKPVQDFVGEGGKILSNIVEGVGTDILGKQGMQDAGKKLSNLSPRVKANIGLVGDVASLLPFGGITKAGEFALSKVPIREMTREGVLSLSKIAEREIPRELTDREIANQTAEKTLGVPLSRAEASAPIGSAPASGFWATIDRTLAKVPGIESVYAGKQQAKEAGFKEAVGRTFNAPNNVEQQFQKSLEADLDLRKKTFNDMYQMFEEQGKRGYIDGEGVASRVIKDISSKERIFDKDGNILSGVKGVSDQAAEKLAQYIGQIKNIGSDITTNTATKAGENYSSWSVLRKNIGGEIGRIRSELSNPMSAVNKSQLGAELNSYNSIYSKMKTAERAHMEQIGGKELAKTWDDVNEIFAEDKPITDTLKKLTGYGKDVGEKGAVSVDRAIKSLLNPDEFQRLDKAMSLMSDDTRNALRGVMLSKIVENASEKIVVNGSEIVSRISVPKLQNQYKAYGKEMLERVIGKDATKQYEDILTTASRANMKQIGLFDTSNPSQTGYGSVLAGLITGMITGGSVLATTKDAKSSAATALGFALLGMPLGKALARTSLNIRKAAPAIKEARTLSGGGGLYLSKKRKLSQIGSP